MRSRETIEKDIPQRVDFNDNYQLEIPRHNQKLLTVILEVLLDIRDSGKKTRVKAKPKRKVKVIEKKDGD